MIINQIGISNIRYFRAINNEVNVITTYCTILQA